jgi:hypothetical protein
MYFAVPSWSQATSGFFGSSLPTSGSPISEPVALQVRASTAACCTAGSGCTVPSALGASCGAWRQALPSVISCATVTSPSLPALTSAA